VSENCSFLTKMQSQTPGVMSLLLVLQLLALPFLCFSQDAVLRKDTPARRHLLEDLNLKSLKDNPPKLFGYTVKDTIAHNAADFTEGLAFRLGDSHLYESVGLFKRSHISIYNVNKGKNASGSDIEKVSSHDNDEKVFAEGLTFFQDKDSGEEMLIQLTYKAHKAYVYKVHQNSLDLKYTLGFPPGVREGWGITTSANRKVLVMSDGSPVLHFMQINKETKMLEVVKHITVHDCFNRMPRIHGLNELEIIPAYVSHQRLRQHSAEASPWYEKSLLQKKDNIGSLEFIWANVIGTWCTAVIDPESGQVLAWVDTKNIDSHFDRFNKVQNGIAYRTSDDTLWMTGIKSLTCEAHSVYLSLIFV